VKDNFQVEAQTELIIIPETTFEIEFFRTLLGTALMSIAKILEQLH
jgi:hypothetical protein